MDQKGPQKEETIYSIKDCDTDLLILSYVRTPIDKKFLDNVENLLFSIIKNASKSKEFCLKFGGLKVYKDGRIALRSTVKANAKTIDEKMRFLGESKKILLESQKIAFDKLGLSLSEKIIVFVVFHQVGNEIEKINEKLKERWTEKGIKIMSDDIGGYIPFTCVYTEREFIVLSRSSRKDGYPITMDLVYDIVEDTFVKEDEIIFIPETIRERIEKFKEKGLEMKREIETVSIWESAITASLFIGGILVVSFLIITYIENYPIISLGGLMILLSFLPISIDYYKKITSKKILLK